LGRSLKGWARGESHPNAKLTETKVQKALQLFFDEEWLEIDIAALFHVSNRLISGIVRGEKWPHITRPFLLQRGFVES
jgi:hypothetical protein